MNIFQNKLEKKYKNLTLSSVLCNKVEFLLQYRVNHFTRFSIYFLLLKILKNDHNTIN